MTRTRIRVVVRYALGCTYRKCNTLRGIVHALHVHVWTEQRNPAVRIPVGLETFEQLLGIVEHGRTRVKDEGAVYESFPLSGRKTARTQRVAYKALSEVHPIQR